MTKNPNHRYQIVTGPDNIYWISLQPLLADLRQLYDSCEDDHLKTHTATVINFINSLILEQQVTEWKVDPKVHDDELPYSESLH